MKIMQKLSNTKAINKLRDWSMKQEKKKQSLTPIEKEYGEGYTQEQVDHENSFKGVMETLAVMGGMAGVVKLMDQ